MLKLLLPILILVSLACGRASSPGRAEKAQRVADPRALCLAPQAAATPIGRDLQAQQARARQAPDDPSAWVAAGQGFVRVARLQMKPELYASADACAQLALERSRQYGPALALQGLVLQNDHRFAEARALALRMVAADPDDPMAQGILSDAELELGNLDAAIRAAQRMLDLKPSLAAYGRAAHLHFLQGDSAGAKRLYELAIATGRRDRDREPSAFMISEAALLFWHEGDYAGADAGFDFALREVADYAPALEGKGRVALARGDYAGAARQLERALQQRATVETAWLLGDARALAGDARGAQQAYARVVEDGRRHDPRSLALFFAVKQREPAEALALARADYQTRQDLYGKAVLAFALYRAGQFAQADTLSQQALASGIADARLLYRAGLIAKATGDHARGRGLIERALRLNPRFDPTMPAVPGAMETADARTRNRL